MNIESKRFKAKTNEWGYVEITVKSTGRMVTIPRSDLPSDHALAMMNERAFDALMQSEVD